MRQLVTKTSAVEKAARLARDGALDAALKQYRDLFAMYPSDWGVANALGDLYVRVGRTDDAVTHFVKLAEQLEADGYTAKARAVYRKVLRMRPGHELAQVRVVELEARHLETGVVVNRAIAAARVELGPARDENGGASAEEHPPAAALPLIPLPAQQPFVTVPAEMPHELPAAATAPPLFVAAPSSASVGEGWPSPPEAALPCGTESPLESVRRPPSFEELLDRLDPDRAEPRECLEDALDDLDPVLPATPARPVEDALEEMDPRDAESTAIGLDVPSLESLDTEDVPCADDFGEGGGIDEEEAEEYESGTVDDGACATGVSDGQIVDGDATALDPEPESVELEEPNGEHQQEEYDLDGVDWGAVEEHAPGAGGGNEISPLGLDDSGAAEAYSLEAPAPDTIDAGDTDADELTRLLTALEEQTRAGGRPAPATLPDTAIVLPLSKDHADGEALTEDPDEFAPSAPSVDDELVHPAQDDGPYDADVEIEFVRIEAGVSSGNNGEPAEEELQGDLAGIATGLDSRPDEFAGTELEPHDSVVRTEDALGSANAVVESTPAEEQFDIAAPSADSCQETAWPLVEPAADAGVPALDDRFEVAVTAVEDRFDPAELRLMAEPELNAPGRSGDDAPAADASPEERFEEIRIAILDGVADGVRAGLVQADELVAAGELARAAHLLHETMCALPLRHAACARLARLYRETGDIASAMECLEWAAEREPADGAAGHELAYELALTLEAMGQRDHALGIYRELLSEVGPAFRDVAARV